MDYIVPLPVAILLVFMALGCGMNIDGFMRDKKPSQIAIVIIVVILMIGELVTNVK